MKMRAGSMLLAALSVFPVTVSAEKAPVVPGLIGIVFDNPAMQKPVRVWSVPEPRAEHFAPIARHDFSLVLIGRLEVPFAGDFDIRAVADDGIRLRLDGTAVIDGWAREGVRFGRARAGASSFRNLEVEYFLDGGAPKLALWWRPVGATEWALVPASAFTHTAEQAAATRERFAALMREFERVVAEVVNPHPGVWPGLHFVQQGVRPLLRLEFPDLPDFTCDGWMYESETDLLAARDAGGGVMEVRHALRAAKGVLVVSTIRPERGAVEIAARLELADGRAATLPPGLEPLNLCWQLRRAPAFAAYPEPYEQFMRRCFVFTKSGRTFLDRTVRLPSARFPTGDPVNNPPWVQTYLPAWVDADVARPFPWAGVSPDRIAATVAGVVSREGNHLAALATDRSTSISQVWVDCLHNNPDWTPGDAEMPPSWRVKIYLMPDDPAALLRRVAADFPVVRTQPAFETVAGGTPAR